MLIFWQASLLYIFMFLFLYVSTHFNQFLCQIFFYKIAFWFFYLYMLTMYTNFNFNLNFQYSAHSRKLFKQNRIDWFLNQILTFRNMSYSYSGCLLWTRVCFPKTDLPTMWLSTSIGSKRWLCDPKIRSMQQLWRDVLTNWH